MNREQAVFKRRALLTAYAPLVIWVGVIFFLSSGSGSMAETSRFIGPLLRFLFPAAPEETIQLYHAFIRKCAHFTEYAVLGLLACRALRLTSITFLRTKWVPAALTLVVLVAVTDEFNQSFNPARTSSEYDVLLDIFGGVCAIGAFYLLKRWTDGRSAINRPRSPAE